MKTKFKKTILSLAASTLVLSPFSIAHAGSSNLVYYLPNESCPQKGYTIPIITRLQILTLIPIIYLMINYMNNSKSIFQITSM